MQECMLLAGRCTNMFQELENLGLNVKAFLGPRLKSAHLLFFEPIKTFGLLKIKKRSCSWFEMRDFMF